MIICVPVKIRSKHLQKESKSSCLSQIARRVYYCVFTCMIVMYRGSNKDIERIHGVANLLEVSTESESVNKLLSLNAAKGLHKRPP